MITLIDRWDQHSRRMNCRVTLFLKESLSKKQADEIETKRIYYVEFCGHEACAISRTPASCHLISSSAVISNLLYVNIPRIIVSLIVLLRLKCRNEQKYDVKTLPTGKQVKVLSIHPLTFGDGTTSMVLAYQTDLKITDSVALRKEVQEIWFFFRDEVNRTNFRGAVISANEVPTGFIVTQNKTFNFVFQKNQDSAWTMSPDYGSDTSAVGSQHNSVLQTAQRRQMSELSRPSH